MCSTHQSALLLAPGTAKLAAVPGVPGSGLSADLAAGQRCPGAAAAPGALPVLLGQQELLKVQVQLLSRGGPDRPHAVHAARLVPGVAGREDAADGGVVDRAAAGRCQERAQPR